MRVLHLRPHPSAQEKGGRPVRPGKNSAREKVFLRPRSAYRAFPCGKRKTPTPLPMCRGQGGALLFSADAAGDGTAKARALTTLPADAHNVTQSRKICGSPRFALFRMAAL
jgi:hypothetical protein